MTPVSFKNGLGAPPCALGPIPQHLGGSSNIEAWPASNEVKMTAHGLKALSIAD